MKVDSLSGVKQKSRFGDSDSKKFGLAEEAHGLIMKYLTDLYDNPTLAAIRETISNALDAHSAANTSEKIKVYNYSYAATPYFQVSDHGVGMSRETLLNVYTQYGVSTKRNDDSAIGGFGLGCKSPLAIEDRFYIETTHEGTTIVAEVFKNTEGEFRLDINDEYESGNPSGTTVRINLHKTSPYDFRANLHKFLKFVNPDLYDLENSPGDELTVEYELRDEGNYTLISSTDDFKAYVATEATVMQNAIVMGEVAYNYNLPSQDQIPIDFKPYGMSVVIVAPINSVTITTSRENTQDTKKTRDFINKVYVQLDKDLKEYLQNYIDEATTPPEVYKRLNYASSIIRMDYTYQGNPIISKLVMDNDLSFTSKRAGGQAITRSVENVTLDTNSETFIVVDDDTPETKNGAITRSYTSFLTSYDTDYGMFYFLSKDEETPESWWIDENPKIHVIKKADILTTASEWRKKNRKPTTRGEVKKVKYTVVSLDTEKDKDQFTIREVEYPEIKKGIKYLTQNDLQLYGICTQPSSTVYDNVNTLRETLELFGITEDVLVLTGNKQVHTMEKRTNATHLVFDVLSLRKYIGQAQQVLVNQRVRYITRWHETVLEYIGEEKYNSLKDPRFKELFQLGKNNSDEEAISDVKYNMVSRIIRGIEYNTSHQYYKDNRSKLDKLGNDWNKACSYEASSKIISERFKGSQELEAEYSRYIPTRPTFYTVESCVSVLNAIYDDFLSKK